MLKRTCNRVRFSEWTLFSYEAGHMGKTRLIHANGYWVGQFNAMASPCEFLMEVHEQEVAISLLDIAAREALRIEQKFSRYRDDNIIHAINTGNGKVVEVDEETAQLLDYAAQCYQLSDGFFDITSGVLRQGWRFDGNSQVPSKEHIASLLPRIGWHKVTWNRPMIQLPPGMEVDLGGIGKEYATDRIVLLLKEQTDAGFLVNLGGDIATHGPRQNGAGWFVGVEDPDKPLTLNPQTGRMYELKRGAIATSGDARRFILKDGVRYGHIFNPYTGFPEKDAPRSVTVVTDTCTEAGILATLAMLHGARAESFLEKQGVKYWCVR